MADIKFAHAKKLYDSLCNYTDQDTAEGIVSAVPLSKTPNDKKRAEWAVKTCNLLNEQFDGQTVRKIRMGCACKPSKSKMEKMKKLYDIATSLSDFIEKTNQTIHEHRLWEENGVIYLSYPVCYCSIVKRAEESFPKEWCYCTLGYTKLLFEYIFDCPVEAQLIESIKTGGKQCVMSVIRSK